MGIHLIIKCQGPTGQLSSQQKHLTQWGYWKNMTAPRWKNWKPGWDKMSGKHLQNIWNHISLGPQCMCKLCDISQSERFWGILSIHTI
jgi:hypothetical protein